MKIHGATVLVTGANRGIGLAFTRELLARGARKVYAGARDPKSVTLPGVEAIRLDVTKPEEVAAAAARLGDVTLVINNAGVGHVGGFLATDSEEVARRQLETNYFGVLRMSKAFAPILAAHGGGGLINVLFVVTWVNNGFLAAYSASKSAAWSLTNSLRHELQAQNTQVLALHMGFVDTDLVRGLDAPKVTAEDIVNQALDGLEAGADEVLGDDWTRQVKAGLSSGELPAAAGVKSAFRFPAGRENKARGSAPDEDGPGAEVRLRVPGEGDLSTAARTVPCGDARRVLSAITPAVKAVPGRRAGKARGRFNVREPGHAPRWHQEGRQPAAIRREPT